jgi:hypothetical protein
MRSWLCGLVMFAACSSGPAAPREVAEAPREPKEEVPVAVAKDGALVTELPAAAPDDGPVRARAAFARALAQIEPGMKEADVVRLVGPADDVRTERDPGGISAARTVEVWRWGTNGHLSFGTLGTVHVQADRTVQYVFGGGTPVAVGVDEAELRRLLRLLAAVPGYGERLDPLALIRAVNALQRRGKSTALAAIDEFLRVASHLDDPGREGVFLVVRALFDAPPGQALPPMLVGSPSPVPADMSALPRHPLVLVDELPLSVTSGYLLAGHAESPEMHLGWYRTHGLLRAGPLRPPDDPLAAAERAFAPGSALARAASLDDEHGRAFVYDQALRAIDGVYRPAIESFDRTFADGPDVAGRWQAARAAAARPGTKWDAAREVYTRADGRLLAPAPRELRPRTLWDLPLGAKAARMALEWKGPRRLGVEVRVELAAGQSTPAATLRFVDAASGAAVGEVAVQATAAPSGSTAGMVTGTTLTASPGVRLRAELVVAGAIAASGVFTP